MKNCPYFITSLAITVSLFGPVTVPVHAADEPHSAHQVAEAPGTRTTNPPAANPFAKEARVDADTQSPPGVVGKKWPEPVEDSQIYLWVPKTPSPSQHVDS